MGLCSTKKLLSHSKACVFLFKLKKKQTKNQTEESSCRRSGWSTMLVVEGGRRTSGQVLLVSAAWIRKCQCPLSCVENEMRMILIIYVNIQMCVCVCVCSLSINTGIFNCKYYCLLNLRFLLLIIPGHKKVKTMSQFVFMCILVGNYIR